MKKADTLRIEEEGAMASGASEISWAPRVLRGRFAGCTRRKPRAFSMRSWLVNTLNNLRQPTRAACVNLIQGKLRDVVAFLNELSYGDATASKLKGTKQRWTATLRSMSKWHPK